MACMSKYRRLHSTSCTTARSRWCFVFYDKNGWKQKMMSGWDDWWWYCQFVIQCMDLFFLSITWFLSASWRNILRASGGLSLRPHWGSAAGPRCVTAVPQNSASAPSKPKSCIRPCKYCAHTKFLLLQSALKCEIYSSCFVCEQQ